MMNRTRMILPIVGIAVLALFLAGCNSAQPAPQVIAGDHDNDQAMIGNVDGGNVMAEKQDKEETKAKNDDSAEPSTPPASVPDSSDWKDIQLKDVNTGNTFKISDFKGKPVLVESFAVWCPTCTKQQKEIKKLHDLIGDDVVSVALDTDSNEEESKIKAHAERNGFDWNYVVSPPELTRKLIDTYGTSIVNAPSTPMILVCEDGSERFLGRGLKTASDLQAHLAQGCDNA